MQHPASRGVFSGHFGCQATATAHTGALDGLSSQPPRLPPPSPTKLLLSPLVQHQKVKPSKQTERQKTMSSTAAAPPKAHKTKLPAQLPGRRAVLAWTSSIPRPSPHLAPPGCETPPSAHFGVPVPCTKDLLPLGHFSHSSRGGPLSNNCQAIRITGSGVV